MNTESAERNMARALDALGMDLYTRVVDWNEFRDLQVAFLRASTPDAEIPTDHAIMATLYQVASERGIRHILLGTNIRTEAVLPKAWARGHLDWQYPFRSSSFWFLHLRTYPHMSALDFVRYTFIKGIKTVPLLNAVAYLKDMAKSMLAEQLGWRLRAKTWGVGLHEVTSIINPPKEVWHRQAQAHFSSLICSESYRGSCAASSSRVHTRLTRLVRQAVNITKLGLTEPDFERIMAQPPKCMLTIHVMRLIHLYEPVETVSSYQPITDPSVDRLDVASGRGEEAFMCYQQLLMSSKFWPLSAAMAKN